MTPPPPPGELHSSVLESLGARIVSGELPAGRVLNLEGICTEFAVSRSVAREAVRVLEAMGMVSSRRRVGITIRGREGWNVFDPRVIRWRLDAGDRTKQLLSLSELRRGFEPVAAGLAARNATEEQRATISAAAKDLEKYGAIGDLEPYLEADARFHDTLLIASGNEMLQALSGVVVELLAARTHHGLMPDQPNPQAIELHVQIADAVSAGDAQRAETAMREIIDEAAAALAAEQN